jgi:soluble lytic murein transglycosylase-like protein
MRFFRALSSVSICLGLAVVVSIPASAGELVVLTSGSQLSVDRHELCGDMVRLFQGSGTTEIPSRLIVSVEQTPAVVEEAASPITPLEVIEQAAPSSVIRAAPSTTPADARTLVREAALRSGLPPEFVASVAQVESAFQPNALSPKGAIGVMQLMPETAKTLGADPHDMAQNIDAGARLLRDLLVKYDGDVVKTLSAYNAGEGAVARYDGLPPYDETRFYVNKVIGAYKKAGGK